MRDSATTGWQTIYVCKAGAIGPEPVAGVVISITREIPTGPLYEPMDIAVWRDWLNDQAADIEEALIASLPGGVYDRLMMRMMERKASLLRVPLGDSSRSSVGDHP